MLIGFDDQATYAKNYFLFFEFSSFDFIPGLVRFSDFVSGLNFRPGSGRVSEKADL